MGLWSLYFAAKIYLFYRGYIRFDVLLNCLFFVFLLIPLPTHAKSAGPVKVLKSLLSVIFGVLLFWHDTWFPAPLDAFRLLKQNGVPSREYIYSFLLRFYNPKEIAIVAGILVVCVLVRNFRKTIAVVTAMLLILPLIINSGEASYQSGDEIDQYLSSFYNKELTKRIHFKPSQGGSPDFDILILHVCSLSWNDLQDLNMDRDPFFKEFDYLFTNFNSVTTYSNPSAIRLLNANCGQRKHADLYNVAQKECSLTGSLRDEGYEIDFARNHDGKYGKFDEEVKRLGQLDAAPFRVSGLTARKFMFDDSPVYDDYPVLEQWWKARQQSKSRKVALYYNTVTLHDGTHWRQETAWWNKDEKAQYKDAVRIFLSDMTKFFNVIASSGRNVVVIFVAEHGRSIHGSTIAPSGLRDIPLPRISTVPVGVKLFGKGYDNVRTGRNIIIAKPTSYFALSYMLSEFTAQSPFKIDRYSSRTFIDSIPQTSFVSENQDDVIVKDDDSYYLFGKDKKWTLLTEKELE